MQNTSVRDLPPNYTLLRKLDIREGKALLWMNLLGLTLFILAWIVFARLANLAHPGSLDGSFSISAKGLLDLLAFVGLLLAVTVVMLVLHEGFHGLCFWLFTRARPVFAFKGFYAYAAAPDWYLPREQYLITGLAPLVGITALFTALMFALPAGWTRALFWMLVLNTSGAAGDLWMVWALLRSPADLLARDRGEVLEIFAPEGVNS